MPLRPQLFNLHMQLPFDPETLLLRKYDKDAVMERSNAIGTRPFSAA